MNIYEKKGSEFAKETYERIRSCPRHTSLGFFSSIALELAEEVALSTMAGNGMAINSIRQAKELAAKEDFDRIILIATDELKRDAEKDDSKTRARLFLHKAINIASQGLSLEDEDEVEFEKFLACGYAILCESDPSVDWKKRFEKKILI